MIRVRISHNKEMETLIIETEGKKLKALISVLSALDIPFRKKESSYDPEFVARIRESEEDIKAGRVTKVTTKSELGELLNSL